MYVRPAIIASSGSSENRAVPLQVDDAGNLLCNIAQGSFAVSSGAQYNATPPTLANGATGPLQCDVNGKMLIAGTINASSSATYNSSVQTFSNASSNPLQADVHGALLVTQRDSAGAVQGALANPIRTDPTGTTTQPVSGTFWQATQPVSGTFWQATQPVSGTVAVSGSVAVTGTFWQATQPVSIAATVNVAATPKTSGGLSTTKLISAATTNATSVKASAGQLYSAQIYNTSAANKFFKLHDSASAPTVGSTAVKKCWMVPPGGGIVLDWSAGIAFGSGIAYSITGAAADADTTAVAAGDVIVNLDYA